MSAPRSVIEAQVQSLLELVENQRETRCAELREEAERQARVLLAEAHAEARRRMHQVAEEERLHAREQIAAAEAQLQTRIRQQQHKTALLMLHEGWEQLGEAVLRRWKDEAGRRRWIGALLRQALHALPHCSWTIQHPPGWDPAECAELNARIHSHCGEAPHFESTPELHAGLRISTEGACLDGSLEGLLSDRHAIEAQLLAQLNRLLANGSEETHP